IRGTVHCTCSDQKQRAGDRSKSCSHLSSGVTVTQQTDKILPTPNRRLKPQKASLWVRINFPALSVVAPEAAWRPIRGPQTSMFHQEGTVLRGARKRTRLALTDQSAHRS